MTAPFGKGPSPQAGIRETLATVKNKLLVLSGKGGVGKSTIAVHLAVGLARRRLATGLLDVDLHGPSIPKMLGLEERKVEGEGGRLKPLAYNPYLSVLSMASIVGQADIPVIWRGPRKGAAIRQLLGEVNWGPLDFLIIDAPPGTGDEPLSVAQWVPGLRALVVTTPQQVAIEDVRRSLRFLEKASVPIAGIIENMGPLVCPHCGGLSELFGQGGGARLAEEWNVPFLGRVPFDPRLMQAADAGHPIFDQYGDSPTARAFQEMVEVLLSAG